MIGSIKSFKLGDYITVNNVTGRVTERNLLHVEVQSEESDLVSLANAHMVAYPVKVVRSSGTIVSIDISLGYDIPHQQITRLLCLASEDAGLAEGFVQIKSLGDFSVTYRIAGLLTDLSKLLSVRSQLHAAVLDRLHGESIEIVSPNFMNTRSYDHTVAIPKPFLITPDNSGEGQLEKLAFEKADAVSNIANIRSTIEELSSHLETGHRTLSDTEREKIESRLSVLAQRLKLAEEDLQMSEDRKVEPS